MKTTFNIRQMPATRFGFNVAGDLVKDIRDIGAEKVLLIVDLEMKELGLTQKVEQQLRDAFEKVEIHIIRERVLSFGSIEQIRSELEPGRFDLIVGYGGWRCTDLCKVVSIASRNEFTAQGVKEGKLDIQHHGIPVISVPTTPPNGAEIDDSVMIREDENNRQIYAFSHPFMAPRLTVIDPALMLTIPRDLTASTGIDAISHAIEALISIDASPFSEMYALQGFALLKENLVAAFRQPENVKARYNVALGSLYAALALNMTGSGAVHAMSFPLTARYDISHPQASSLMLPYIMKYNLPVVPMQFVRMARYLGKQVNGDEGDAGKAIDALFELYQLLDHPVDLRAYNVPRIDIDLLVDDVMAHGELLARNPRILDKQQIKQIFEEAM